MQKVYISCPVALNVSVLLGIAEKLQAVGKFDVKYWTRGSYDPSLLNNADIFVFLTPDNSFNINKERLPVGVRRELETAIRQGKHIFMVYQNGQGEYNFYKTNLSLDPNCDMIRGQAGTTSDIFIIKKELDYNTWSDDDEDIQPLSKQDMWSKTMNPKFKKPMDKRLLLCVNL